MIQMNKYLLKDKEKLVKDFQHKNNHYLNRICS